MTADPPASPARARPGRIIGWSVPVLILAAHALAGADWDETDYLFAAVMFATAGGLVELAVWLSGHWAYRAGFAVAVLGGFLTIWINLAVGIVGGEANPFNLWFGAVLAVGAFGALVAGFRARGMARAMVATAVAQAGVCVLALATGAGFILPITLFFAGFWLTAAALFRRAARESEVVLAGG